MLTSRIGSEQSHSSDTWHVSLALNEIEFLQNAKTYLANFEMFFIALVVCLPNCYNKCANKRQFGNSSTSCKPFVQILVKLTLKILQAFAKIQKVCVEISCSQQIFDNFLYFLEWLTFLDQRVKKRSKICVSERYVSLNLMLAQKYCTEPRFFILPLYVGTTKYGRNR